MLAICLAAVSAVSAQVQQRYPQIIRQNSDLLPDGGFQYGFETEDGIRSEARGTPVSSNARDAEGRAEGRATAVRGSYSYTGADGQVYTVNYVADENGFQPQGAHLPVPPAIPEEILKSLEYNAAHPEEDEEVPNRRN